LTVGEFDIWARVALQISNLPNDDTMVVGCMWWLSTKVSAKASLLTRILIWVLISLYIEGLDDPFNKSGLR
jgi:hypothetical protein